MAWDPFQPAPDADVEGADFSVPSVPSAARPDPPTREVKTPDAEGTLRSSIRVMVVGRDDDDRADTVAVVANCGFTVEGDARYGTQSHVVLDECEPDVILVAVEEPPTRALATIASLRERRPTAPVVEFYGVDDPTIMRAAMRAGVYDFVRRPTPGFGLSGQDGEWFWGIEEAGRPQGYKAGQWKTPYHNGRAMLMCLEQLSGGPGG